ncbi:hypothetical protein BOTBODRAFT_160628 [Botryobasidium botryosum FD-172 SS1]|uniref:CCAAT-binding factor domain-containing protein n=1 Tax=Botryobasidium botryosum (strain FD-172 SS1) TaxID=930990 RepID=A0A067MP56_BOTB1|nr:hypothetical protein BOTBODRAFT_160628 [Botryobasidium botryosum FD-172 SS1]
MPGPSLPPQKKRKTSKSAEELEIRQTEEILTLAISNSSSLNPLADLVTLLSSTSDAVVAHKAAYALYRVFVLLISGGRMHNGGGTEESKVVRKWLAARFEEYVDMLCGFLKDENKALKTASLQILFSLLKHLSTALSASTSQVQLDTLYFRKVVRALLFCPSSPRYASPDADEGGKVDADIRDMFVDTWFGVYDDLRWFFFREATLILRSTAPADTEHAEVAHNVLSFLERLKTMPTEASELNSFWITEFSTRPRSDAKKGAKSQDDASDEEDLEDDWRTYFDEPEQSSKSSAPARTPRIHTLTTHQSLHSLASHRAQFSICWISLVRKLSSSSALSSRALAVLHRGVLPHFNRPVRLMDWVGGCVDFGGSVGLVALNALFTLIKDHNLDYPDFYTRLYAFFTRDVLHLKYRARFFRLTDLFLSSTHLSAALLASFIKRLSRLSLSAPPAAIVMIIPFVYNVLKRHPALMVMIHRDDMDSSSDPFDANEPSPLLTNAISSSLWELATHREHYISSVSTLARIFTEAFTKAPYSMEDFLDHTYATLFETEAKRKIRKEPALKMELVSGPLFPVQRKRAEDEEVAVEAIPGDVVVELWSF